MARLRVLLGRRYRAAQGAVLGRRYVRLRVVLGQALRRGSGWYFAGTKAWLMVPLGRLYGAA